MQSRTPVEIADRLSRKRVLLSVVAAAAFLIVQLLTHPFFHGGVDSSPHTRIWAWGVNALGLLLILANGGGLVFNRQLRALMHDELSRSHQRTAVITGYWIAMAMAMGLYALPVSERMSARDAVYLVVTPSVGIALLVFAWLEHRAHRDA